MESKLYGLNKTDYKIWNDEGWTLTALHLEKFKNSILYGEYLTDKQVRLRFIPEGKIKKILYEE